MRELKLLIKKDLVNLMAISRWFPILMVVLSLIFGALVPPYSICFVPSLWIYVVCYNLFVVEQREQSQILVLTLPIHQKHFVTARFLVGVLGGTALSALGAISNFLFSLYKGEPSASLTILAMGFCLSALMGSAMMGAVFVFGLNKSKLFGVGIYLLGILILPNFFLNAPLLPLTPVSIFTSVAICAVFTLLFHRVSQRYFQKYHLMER